MGKTIATKATKQQLRAYREQLLADHPQTDPFFVDLLLDVYERNAGFVEALAKKHRGKGPPTSPVTPKRTLTEKGIRVLAEGEYEWPEQEANAKFLGAESSVEISELTGKDDDRAAEEP